MDIRYNKAIRLLKVNLSATGNGCREFAASHSGTGTASCAGRLPGATPVQLYAGACTCTQPVHVHALDRCMYVHLNGACTCTGNDGTGQRHCERSEAIQLHTPLQAHTHELDCFTSFAMTTTGSVIGRGVGRITIRRGVARNASTKGAPVIGSPYNKIKQKEMTGITGFLTSLPMKMYVCAISKLYDYLYCIQLNVSSISCRVTKMPEQAPKPTLPPAHRTEGNRCGLLGLLPKRWAAVAAACILVLACPAFCQQIAVKKNALYWATATPNIGAEVGLGANTTLNLEGGYNPWNVNGSGTNYRKLAHLLVLPEYRYWLWERFNGHFIGVHGLYSSYDFSGRTVPFLFDNEHRYQGTAYWLGVTYCFHLMLSPAWGIEASFGAGVARLAFDKSACLQCNPFPDHISETYVGPTKIGVSLIYIIK